MNSAKYEDMLFPGDFVSNLYARENGGFYDSHDGF